MAPDDPQLAGMSRSRVALLGAYAALDPRLEHELRYVGVRFDGPLDAYSQLQAAAESIDEQQRPRIHQLQLARALMAVLQRADPPEDGLRPLRPVVELLVDPGLRLDDIDPVSAVYDALKNAANSAIEMRWSQVVEEVGQYLHPELSVIPESWCRSELRSVDNEIVSRIETKLVVRHSRDLQQIAPAALPQNWSQCNDFFCDLIRVPERDLGCVATTGGDLSAGTPYWRGVYEERVGTCPAGWFPDTFLLFTWDCSERQLILSYELAPRRGNDRTVLKIDQGYVQVDRLIDTYEVSTVKYLLFDDDFIPGGGQTLGQAACQLGWLDYSLNQFSACAETLSPTGNGTGTGTGSGGGGGPRAGLDAGLQQVLDRCEANLQQTVADAEVQFGTAMDKIRCGTYSLDDYVGDWGKLAVRAIRDGSRSLQGQVDFAMRSLEVVRALAPQKDTNP